MICPLEGSPEVKLGGVSLGLHIKELSVKGIGDISWDTKAVTAPGWGPRVSS